MERSYFYTAAGSTFKKVTLQQKMQNSFTWLVKDEQGVEFVASQNSLLPKPRIVSNAEKQNQQPPTYIWYKQAKFAAPWIRVQLLKMQDGKCTVLDLDTREKIRLVDSNMLMPKPQIRKVLIDKAIEEAFNSLNLIVLAKGASGYGQVREIKTDKARIVVEFPQNQRVVWSVSDTRLVVIDKRKDVTYANEDITLYLIRQLMQHASNELIEEYFARMLIDDTTAVTYLFERLIHPKQHLLVEQRNLIYEQLVVPWLDQTKSTLTTNVWLDCTFDIDEQKKTWTSDAVFQQVMQRLKKYENVEFPTFDMHNMYDFLRFLSKGRNKLSKFLKTLDDESFIWYTIQLFNDIFGDDGMQYQTYLAEWPDDDDGDTLTDSYYTWFELNQWKAAVLKTKSKQLARVIEHAFDLLFETYAKCIKNYGELDEQAVDFDLQKEAILIGDLRFIADYKKVVNVMREILDDIDAAGKSDDIGVDLVPVERAFENAIELAK